MLFKQDTPLYSYEVIGEAGTQVMYVNYLGAPFVPSISDNPVIMSRAIELLTETPDISRIVLCNRGIIVMVLQKHLCFKR